MDLLQWKFQIDFRTKMLNQYISENASTTHFRPFWTFNPNFCLENLNFHSNVLIVYEGSELFNWQKKVVFVHIVLQKFLTKTRRALINDENEVICSPPFFSVLGWGDVFFVSNYKIEIACGKLLTLNWRLSRNKEEDNELEFNRLKKNFVACHAHHQDAQQSQHILFSS